MRMFDCSSSLIHSYGFDPASLEMKVKFNEGGTYVYKGMTQDRFEEFVRAPSKGKHFLKAIKGKYEWVKE